MLKHGAALTLEEMTQLRSNIEHMHTPSWLTSVPTNLGKPSHSKLKADQWRTLGTTYLPVCLFTFGIGARTMTSICDNAENC